MNRRFPILGVLVVLGAALVIGALWLALRDGHAKAHAERAHEAELGPVLSTVVVGRTAAARQLVLTAEARAYVRTTMYAKLSGYVRKLYVERGQRVKKGALIAELESPETERDVEAARSDLLVKRITAERTRTLARSKLAAPQDRDDSAAAERIALATYERSLATLRYSELRAPFDGIVAARYVDPGALLPAATGSTQSAMPLVDLAEIDRLRVFVYVGQDAAPFVHDGDQVEIWQDELPSRRIPAQVTRSTGSLDARTRTMEVEIVVDNRTANILPGTFVRVALHLEVPESPTVPNEAFLFRDGKMNVALVENGRVHFRTVDVGATDGKTTRVARGLEGGEIIGVDVPIEVDEGSAVRTKPR
jgi:RND family efflux transporter MFP subunit